MAELIGLKYLYFAFESLKGLNYNIYEYRKCNYGFYSELAVIYLLLIHFLKRS